MTSFVSSTKQRLNHFIPLAIVFTLVFLAGCGQPASIEAPLSGKIKIATSISFYSEAAKAVGGDQIEVISIITGTDADPHEFEPTPDTAVLVNDAHLIVYNGLGYDDWMSKLIKSSSSYKSKKIIRVGEDVLNRKKGDNEHVWYDPQAMPKLAKAIAEQLALIDPPHASDYRQRADDYEASFAPLNDLISRLKQSSTAGVAVSEPVFDYMLQALNYTVSNSKFAKAIASETDPAPKDIARLQEDIQNKKIKFFVHNIQSDSPVITNIVNLAIAHQIPVIEVTETEPPGMTYIEWMTTQLNQLETIMGAS